MNKKSFFASFAALSLLLSGVAACNQAPASNPSSSKTPASQASNSSSKSSSSKSSSSKSPAVPTPDANQQLVTQVATPDADGNGETITWSAQDANKDASSGFDSNGKFKAAGDYVQFTFNASMKMKARLFVEMPPRTGSSDSAYDREAKTGNQSIWYDYYNGPDWKYGVTVNTIQIDQDKMGTYKVGDADVDFKELMYQDFLADGASTLEAPWFEFDVLEGRNTIRIERTQGYSVSMKSFKVVGTKVAA